MTQLTVKNLDHLGIIAAIVAIADMISIWIRLVKEKREAKSLDLGISETSDIANLNDL